jgi:tRNA threonylcarbamoyl adenosine modification protein YjeE
VTLVATTKAVDHTQDLGAAIAELARPGDIVLLAGELGAGKTALVQGFGRGLGITERITSPTFMLARQHAGGRLVLHHLDVYRLEQMQEVRGARRRGRDAHRVGRRDRSRAAEGLSRGAVAVRRR